MSVTDFVILTMELVGTVAFASSGALLAIRKEMDLFGVAVLGVTTSVGGGLIRDLILGITPPNMFRKPVYTMVALGVSLTVFGLMYVRHKTPEGKVGTALEWIMQISDALGLGIFTVVGISTAIHAGYEQHFLQVFVGVMTGVGGGLLRDIMAQEKPAILTRHVYACASIAGAMVCSYSYRIVGELSAMIAGAVVVVVIRRMAAHYRWNLPRVKI